MARPYLSSKLPVPVPLLRPRPCTIPSTVSLLPLPNPTTRTSRATLISMSFSLSPSSPSTMNHKEDENPNPEPDPSKVGQVLKYHNQTKHHFTNYARGPHGLDWANQPNPFRRYISSPLLPLLHLPTTSTTDRQPSDGSAPLYHSLFNSLPPPRPTSKSSVSQLFYDSLALSAWKTTSFSTWSLRVNPSSCNLHPTEAYIIAPPIDSLSDSAFVAHYAPKEHSLELRATLSFDFFNKFFPANSFLIGVSSIFWREAWKYGESAFRYCNHDVGHAIAAIAIAAAGLGWDVKLLDGLGYKDLERLMGLEMYQGFEIPPKPNKVKIPDIEFEHPDSVLVVFPNGVSDFGLSYKDLSLKIREFGNLEWKGKPNLLSKEHVCWDIIYRTAEAVKKPLTLGERFLIDPFQGSGICSERSYKGFTVREVVRKRRSAAYMDGVTKIERDVFYQILLHCLPSGAGSGEKQKRQLALPFRALSWDAEVHAALFVHRVIGLPKGLYFLVRNEDHLDELKKATLSEFEWEKPEGCPEDLPLYELARGDCQQIAKRLSCHQDIASDGCFSLGMVAHFEHTLRVKGGWMYPRLFWETGVLGQVLYLEAHAVGISATGIGCFFDDPEQGAAMNTAIFKFHIPPASMTVFDIVSTSAFILLYDKLILPLFIRITKREPNPPSELQRIGIGLAIATVAIVIAGFVEQKRLKFSSYTGKETSSLSILWQTPQYVLVGVAEAFVYVAQMEFFSSQSPDGLKSLAIALSMANTAIGSYVCSLFLTVVVKITSKNGKPGWIPPNLNHGHLDRFFFLSAGLTAVNLGIYILCAKRYKSILLEKREEEGMK